MNIGELFVTLGIKGQGLGTLKEIGKTIANLPVDAAAAIAGMAGISLELSKMADQAIHTAVAFKSFGNQTGLSWKELQKWQIVAEQANVSTDAVASSVEALERNIQEIRIGRGNIAPFQMLGINPVGQNAFQVIEQLRTRTKGINPAMATNLIAQMGLSPEMMNVLRLSDRQFAEFANRVHGINERQEQDFLKAKLTVTQFGQSFRYAMFGIVSDFVEAIQKSTQFKDTLIAIGLVAAGIAVYFFPVTAAVAALILVLDDLAVYFTGGKSLTGAGLKGLDKFMAELTGNKNFSAIKTFSDAIDAIANAFDRLNNSSESAGASLRRSIQQFFGLGIADKIKAFRDGELPPQSIPSIGLAGLINSNRSLGAEGTARSTTVNMNIQGDGSLDAAGWSNVAHMIRKSVEDAHLQLNN